MGICIAILILILAILSIGALLVKIGEFSGRSLTDLELFGLSFLLAPVAISLLLGFGMFFCPGKISAAGYVIGIPGLLAGICLLLRRTLACWIKGLWREILQFCEDWNVSKKYLYAGLFLLSLAWLVLAVWAWVNPARNYDVVEYILGGDLFASIRAIVYDGRFVNVTNGFWYHAFHSFCLPLFAAWGCFLHELLHVPQDWYFKFICLYYCGGLNLIAFLFFLRIKPQQHSWLIMTCAFVLLNCVPVTFDFLFFYGCDFFRVALLTCFFLLLWLYQREPSWSSCIYAGLFGAAASAAHGLSVFICIILFGLSVFFAKTAWKRKIYQIAAMSGIILLFSGSHYILQSCFGDGWLFPSTRGHVLTLQKQIVSVKEHVFSIKERLLAMDTSSVKEGFWLVVKEMIPVQKQVVDAAVNAIPAAPEQTVSGSSNGTPEAGNGGTNGTSAAVKEVVTEEPAAPEPVGNDGAKNASTAKGHLTVSERYPHAVAMILTGSLGQLTNFKMFSFNPLFLLVFGLVIALRRKWNLFKKIHWSLVCAFCAVWGLIAFNVFYNFRYQYTLYPLFLLLFFGMFFTYGLSRKERKWLCGFTVLSAIFSLLMLLSNAVAFLFPLQRSATQTTVTAASPSAVTPASPVAASPVAASPVAASPASPVAASPSAVTPASPVAASPASPVAASPASPVAVSAREIPLETISSEAMWEKFKNNSSEVLVIAKNKFYYRETQMPISYESYFPVNVRHSSGKIIRKANLPKEFQYLVVNRAYLKNNPHRIHIDSNDWQPVMQNKRDIVYISSKYQEGVQR